MAGPGFYGLGPEFIAVKFESESGFLSEQILTRLEEQNLNVVLFDAEERLIASSGNPIPDERPANFSDYRLRLGIPAGFTDSVLAGEPVQLTFENDAEELGADLNVFRLNRAVYTVLADVLLASGIAADDDARLAALSAEAIETFRSSERTLSLDVSSAGRRLPSGFEQSVPGITVMFTLFVLLTTGATSLVVERRTGILRRLASAPIKRGTIVLGKWGGKFGLAIIQVGFALLIGRFILGVDFGPELPMLLTTLVAYIALVASVAVLAGSLATTEAQAIAVGVLTAMVLAALGGCFWPIEITPDYMQTLAMLLPTGWMMDAMHKLMVFGREWSSALPHLLGMAFTAWFVGLVCAKRFRFE
jgi:ABC-type multidrug transport system permease subunit